MPRVLARRAAAAAATATTATAPSSSPPLEEFEWVEWVDEPRHELLFDVFEQASSGDKTTTTTTTTVARAYAAVFPKGDERWTLFHRHREDTAYVCVSGAAGDDEQGADVWNEVLKELPPPDDDDDDGPGRPTHELLPPVRVIHATGQCFCNPHGTRDKSAYIHRIRYAPNNPNTLHFVGVEVRPRTTTTIEASAGEAAAPPAPHPLLTPEHEQPGLFRTWRLKLKSGESSSSAAAPLGRGFARRGGAVVLIKAADWSKVKGAEEEGPFGKGARGKARAAGGWAAAASASSSSSIFPAGASWPLTPEDGRAEFSLAVDEDGGELEAMLVEFL